MKVLFLANTDWFLYNFRLPLIEAVEARGDHVLLVSPPGSYAEKLRKKGFRWRVFELSRSGINPFAEALTVLRLMRLYRQEAPDLCIHFTIKCLIYGSLAARLAGRKTIVNSVDGLGFVFNERDPKARLLRLFVVPLYRLALRGTLVIFQNPDDRDEFLRRRIVKEGQYVMIRGVGIPLEDYPPVSQETDTPVVLYAGRLLISKGVGVFVEAARRLKAAGVRARFVLVGRADPGNPESIQENDLQDWIDEGVVECWGWRDDMPAVYAQAHIFCLPTIFREGLPRSLMEASASGLALVASNVPGCREVVWPGENGLLVPPNDVEALQNALRRLAENPALRQQMGRRGREIVAQNFSAKEIVRATLENIDAHAEKNA